jgi:hypothetical protein
VLCCTTFKGKRRAVAERRVQAALVVVAEILGEGSAKGGLCGKHDATRELRLQRVKERLSARIVARAADAGALLEPMGATKAQKAAPMYSVPRSL